MYIIFWLAFVVIVAGIHLYYIKVKKQSPNKALWLIIRCVVAILFILAEFFLTDRSMPVVVLAYTLSGWFLHDLIIAVGLGRDPWALNNTGPIDRFQNAAGGSTTWFFFKSLGSITTVIMYFLNE